MLLFIWSWIFSCLCMNEYEFIKLRYAEQSKFSKKGNAIITFEKYTHHNKPIKNFHIMRVMYYSRMSKWSRIIIQQVSYLARSYQIELSWSSAKCPKQVSPWFARALNSPWKSINPLKSPWKLKNLPKSLKSPWISPVVLESYRKGLE